MFVTCFIRQWMERTKHGLYVFPPKKTLIWRRHCSIDQSCCSMTSKQILESSSGMKFVYPSVRLANQKLGAFVSVRYNQSNRSISVRLLFLFCSRVFISRSYENRSNACFVSNTSPRTRQISLALACFPRSTVSEA